jgi:hypothetical protein
MSANAVEGLVLRAAIGEPVCAKITRRVDGELVTLPDKQRMAGTALSAAVFLGIPALAQNPVANPPDATAVLTGRILNADGSLGGHNVGSMVFLHPAVGGGDFMGIVAADGTFEVRAAPGVYEVVVKSDPMSALAIMDAMLHEGAQSLGDVHTQRINYEETVTVGEVAVRFGHGYWVRHPIAYTRLLGRRIRRSFTQ